MARQSPWFAPYLKTGRPAWRPCKRRPGVYLVRRGQDIVYVGHSTKNVRRVMYRHFQAWNDGHAHATYPKRGFMVKVIHRVTARQAASLEKRLIARYQPSDNIFKYGGQLPFTTTAPAVDLYKDDIDLPF